jgi:proline iminopeptidase
MDARERFLAFRRSQPPAPRLGRRTVRARGLDFAVFTSPEVPGATPLLCINGGLLFGHDLLWPALAPLARHRQIVLYDQRGRGGSQAPPGVRAARIEHDASDVPALREALGIPRWNVLGHSWGAGIAMLATAEDQAAVERLVLVSAVGADGSWQDLLVERALPRLDPPDAAALAAMTRQALTVPDPALHLAYSRHMYRGWFGDPALGRLFPPPSAGSLTGTMIAARLRGEGYDWRERVRAVSVPSLVVHGDRDLIPDAIAGDLAATLGHVRLVLLPGVGHMPFWEAPEQFFVVVEEFLSATSPPAPLA